MKFLEKNLEEIIHTSNNNELKSVGLPISGKKFRQVRIGNYGVADLITVERQPILDRLNVTIYELKKGLIEMSTFLQALRYARGIQSWKPDNKTYDYSISICLIGSSVSYQSDFTYMCDIFHEINMYTYSYDFSGIRFKEVTGRSLLNEGF